MKRYVFNITYNFDSDCVVKPCDTYEEAMKILNCFLNEEVKKIEKEYGYKPSILKWSDEKITLVYAEGYTTDTKDRNHACENCADYRIFEVDDMDVDRTVSFLKSCYKRNNDVCHKKHKDEKIMKTMKIADFIR